MALQADPAGTGYLPMGCLDHPGYSMADPKDFYQHMILELVTNKINHSTWLPGNLKPLDNSSGRTEEESWNIPARNAINQHKLICVMYSKAPYARGKISRCMEIAIDSRNDTFWEAHAYAESPGDKKEVRPKFIAVPMPKPDEQPYVWIDMAWPIRGILLPVAQNALPDAQSQCAYVQINFRSLQGRIAEEGFYEDKNQKHTNWLWKGDERLGLFWGHSPATMRVDIKMMYDILLMPRGRREIDDVLAPFQLLRWDTVPYRTNPGDSSDKNVCYEVDKWRENISLYGLPLNTFLERLHGVKFEYSGRKPSKIAATLDSVLGFGLGLVPIAGPLLVYFTTEIINAIEDPGRYQKATFKELGLDDAGGLGKALLESMLQFKKHMKKKFITRSAANYTTISLPLPFADDLAEHKQIPEASGLPLAFADDLAEYEQNPEAFAWEIPAEELISMEDWGEDKEDKEAAASPVAEKEEVAASTVAEKEEADQETQPKVAPTASVAHAEA